MANAFSAPISSGVSLQFIPKSVPVPKHSHLRFAQDPLMWIGLPANTQIAAFATGCVTRVNTTAAIPDFSAGDTWIVFALTPLPQMNPSAFKKISGGLPTQIVVVKNSYNSTSPESDEFLEVGQSFLTAPSGSESTAFLSFAFQDRLCRDPRGWAEEILKSDSCGLDWTQFIEDLTVSPRHVRIIDHRGAPLNQGTVSVVVDNGPVRIAPLAGKDGDTYVELPTSTSTATVSLVSGADNAPNPAAIVASGDSDEGTFGGLGYQLQPGKNMAQVLDASLWLTEPTAGVATQRWHPNSFVEPLQDGNAYFARLVPDLRSAKSGGAVGMGGWAFIKGSFTDSTIEWPLIPGDPDTTLLALIKELHDASVDVKMLINQFLQINSLYIDDFPELVPMMFFFYAWLIPFELGFKLKTDVAGYVVGLVGLGAGMVSSVFLPQILEAIMEKSTPIKDEVDKINTNIATWTPYPASVSDNPLVPTPFKVLEHPIDDITHVGVYHQKYMNIKTAPDAAGKSQYVSYLGGIDISNDRPDTPLHRVSHPFHDLQVRITGPAVADVILTYNERAEVHDAEVPMSVPPLDELTLGPSGSHLVQIARTYFKPKQAESAFKDFAPNGDATTVNTLIAAIEQAKDFIYIEDQYLTPPQSYLQALLAAGDISRNVRALFITMPSTNDQPYGWIRRSQVLEALQNKWQERFHPVAPLRRYLHQTPSLTTNLGRMRLAEDVSNSQLIIRLAPASRIPAPPFWAFMGNELVLILSVSGPPSANNPEIQEFLIVRGEESTWGATPIEHEADTPVIAVSVPGIYVHAKCMIVDDTFLFIGSSNINRRGLYHDGELNSFTIPQHLRGDPNNPARIIRSRLMAEHLGLSPEMGQSLFADALSAIPYYSRSWFEGCAAQPLSFFGTAVPQISLGGAGSVGNLVLQGLVNADLVKKDGWRAFIDPTSALDPHLTSFHTGPELP